MSLTIHLLGRPRITRDGVDAYRFRSRKSWGLLAYLLLSERPAARSELASWLFRGADDPVRALRWGLSEIRRALGQDGSIDGDPVILQLSPDAVVDVLAVLAGSAEDAVATVPALGAELLAGTIISGDAVFETWLLSQQVRLAAASEAVLHEVALRSAARGELAAAISYAVRAVALNALDESHQALLIRLYRLAGDDDAATGQFATCRRLLAEELGASPGPAVLAALRETRRASTEVAVPVPAAAVAPEAAIEALVESGAAAVSVGAVEAGLASLRRATDYADRAGTTRLRVSARLELAQALVHTLGGLDEQALASLHEADEIALSHGLRDEVACARAELGFVEFLRGRYDRAKRWLADAVQFADASTPVVIKALTYLGAVESDRANYQRAADVLVQALEVSRQAQDPRGQAFALAMLGRVSLLTGALDAAAGQLDASVELASRDRWLAFLPFPQALRGEVQLARGDVPGAAERFQQAFARACQIGDPCWEGFSARGLAMAAEASGDSHRAFALLTEARMRCHRLGYPYTWLDAYILDAMCELGVRHSNPVVKEWVEELYTLASRAGMNELVNRAAQHASALS